MLPYLHRMKEIPFDELTKNHKTVLYFFINYVRHYHRNYSGPIMILIPTFNRIKRIKKRNRLQRKLEETYKIKFDKPKPIIKKVYHDVPVIFLPVKFELIAAPRPPVRPLRPQMRSPERAGGSGGRQVYKSNGLTLKEIKKQKELKKQEEELQKQKKKTEKPEKKTEKQLMKEYFAEFEIKYNNPKRSPDYMLPTPQYLASRFYDDDYERFYQLATLLLEPKYKQDFDKQKEYLALQKKLLGFFNIRPHVHNIDEHVRNQVSPIKNCYIPQKKQKKKQSKNYLDDSDIDDFDDPDSILDVYNFDGKEYILIR